MKVMIMTAGRGERMRPLTDSTPKPLIEVAGAPLVTHMIRRLVEFGLTDIVMNLAWLGDQIESALGDGARFGASIQYSREPDGALDSGGGIRNALPLLGEAPFAVVNGDLWTGFPFARLPHELGEDDAHVVLVANPPHIADGDFSLDGDRVANTGPGTLTFSGISVYHPRLFQDSDIERFSVVPLLRRAADNGRLAGQWFGGEWFDLGTVDRLESLRRRIGP